jgi:hypothetical protein
MLANMHVRTMEHRIFNIRAFIAPCVISYGDVGWGGVGVRAQLQEQ